MLAYTNPRYSTAATSFAHNLITQLPFSPLQQIHFMEEQRTYSSCYWVAANQLAPHSLQNRFHEEPLWVPHSFVFEKIYQTIPVGTTDAFPQRSLKTTLQWADVERFYQVDRLKEGVSIIPLLNACFVEETDLFFFLTQTPLTVQQLEASRPASAHSADQASTHMVFLNGFFECIAAAKHYNAWCSLVDAVPKINHQLHLGTRFSRVVSKDGVQSAVVEKEASGSQDYLTHLMAPPPFAGTQRPQVTCETVWIDAWSVCKYQLSVYQDAFWIPCIIRHDGSSACGAWCNSGDIKNQRIPSTWYEHKMSLYGSTYFNTDQLLYTSALQRLLKTARNA